MTSRTMDDYRNSPTIKFCADLVPAHRCPSAIKFKIRLDCASVNSSILNVLLISKAYFPANKMTGVHRFLSISCFISIFSISRPMLAVRISFCNLGFIGYHVFDIRSGHIHFQGQYSLYFFPFVCSIFLVVFFALVVFVFNAFLVIIFLHPLPGFQSYKGV